MDSTCLQREAFFCSFPERKRVFVGASVLQERAARMSSGILRSRPRSPFPPIDQHEFTRSKKTERSYKIRAHLVSIRG